MPGSPRGGVERAARSLRLARKSTPGVKGCHSRTCILEQLRASGRTSPIRNLHHNPDLGVKRRRRATRSVQDLGITAKLPPSLRNPEWLGDLEYVWRIRTADELARLDRRATVRRRAAGRETDPTRRVTLHRSSEWAEHRAQAMAMRRGDVVAACGKRKRRIRCGCGIREIPVGCDQLALCPTCSKQHWRRWRKRITRAMDAHLTHARRSWNRRGMLPGVYLITFTMPHSGCIVSDRARMGEAWRTLTKSAHREQWWGAYALTWEVTPGTAGDGHVHMHAAVISSWVPYEKLREGWQAAMPGSIQPDVSAPKRSRKPAQSAADYLAKYVTKGVDPAVFTGQKAGELLVAFRGKRRVSTSVGFWRPTRDRDTRCQSCGFSHRSCGAPQGLAAVAPGAVLGARAARIGWWVPRGGVQCLLQVSEGADTA